MTEQEMGASRKARGYEDLKRRILTCELEPGDYLDETEIAQAYGMSRPPVREIFRQLAGEGFLLIQENRGAQVTPMTHKTLRHFFMVAPMIYASVAELAAQNATPAQVARLQATQARFRAAIAAGDVASRATLNERFHALIGEMAGNEYLLPSLQRLLIDHTRIGMTFYNSSARQFADSQAIAADQHDAMIEAIAARDPEASARLAVAHWELSREQMQHFVAAPPLEGRLASAG